MVIRIDGVGGSSPSCGTTPPFIDVLHRPLPVFNEENDALPPGQFPDALRVYMEMVKSRQGDVSDMTLAVLHDIRTATLT
jgi:hypothetical protein